MAATHSFARLRTELAFAFYLTLTALVNPASSTNFDWCWTEYIQHLNVTDFDDPNQCWLRNHTTGLLETSNPPFVSKDGCEVLCGHAPQLWPAADTGRRFALFLLPILVLASKFAYVPNSLSAMFCTLLHLLGDPIDSMWSMLIRQEKARRYLTLAGRWAGPSATDVAAIWLAYDIWWQDPTYTFTRALKARGPSPIEATDEVNRPVRSRTTFGGRQHPSAAVDSGSTFDRLTDQETVIIQRAAMALTKERSPFQVSAAWIANYYFLGSIVYAYIRTVTSTQNNQTSHTLAVVMLFSWLLFAVWAGGNVGTFKSPVKVIDTLEKLHFKLPRLFRAPAGDVIPNGISWAEMAEQYPERAPWSGYVSSWRPDKTMKSVGTFDRSRRQLLAISALVVLAAYFPAFLLSYFTPLVGFGCRSGAWTIIAVAWCIVSPALNAAIKLLIPGGRQSDGHSRPLSWYERVWTITLVKDAIIALGAITLVVLAQLGVMNTCWCRASRAFKIDKSDACIDVSPVTESFLKSNRFIWLAICTSFLLASFGLIVLAGWGGDRARMIFGRTQGELDAEAQWATNAKKVLEAGARRASPESSINHADGNSISSVNPQTPTSIHSRSNLRYGYADPGNSSQDNSPPGSARPNISPSISASSYEMQRLLPRVNRTG